MAKLPDNRRPYDPAKAARDRAAEVEKAALAPKLTLAQHMAKKTYLRPVKPAKAED